jgi:response regulator RpfG family c-di-GMP phosphodiesterase
VADGESLRVLIVDDDPAARALGRRLLEQEGYGVCEAIDGVDALARVEQEPPHIIIMDAMMPNMDGLACTQRLKANPATRDTLVIMLSALSDASDIVAGLEAGADEYLAKPIRPKEFQLRVRSMVRVQLGRMELVRSNEVRGEQARILTLLLDFSRDLAMVGNLDKILEKVVAVTAEIVCARRVSIMLPEESGRHLHIAKAIGIPPGIVADVHLPINESTAGRVFQTRTPVVINSEAETRASGYQCDSGIFASVPLVFTALGTFESVIGVLNVTERWGHRPFTLSELEYLDLISSIAASAIHDCLSRQARDEAYDSIVVGLASLAEQRDVETGRHLERVTRFASILAEQLRAHYAYRELVDDDFLRDLRRAVPLHDIGKVAIPDRILLKPGRLTPAETAIMKTHARIGADTLRTIRQRAPGVGFLKLAEEIAEGHHEHYDGSGYPHGLQGSAIPFSARIVALAEVYDALTSKRVYKEIQDHEQAVGIVLRASGTQFDPAVVAAFLEREHEFAQLAVALADEPGPNSNVNSLTGPATTGALEDVADARRLTSR